MKSNSQVEKNTQAGVLVMADHYPEHEIIRLRAYQLYEERGREDGRALEDWLRAVKDITRESEPRATWEAALGLFAEDLARLFHEFRNLLAPDFGCSVSEHAISWEQLAPRQRQLLAATARMVLMHLAREQYGVA